MNSIRYFEITGGGACRRYYVPNTGRAVLAFLRVIGRAKRRAIHAQLNRCRPGRFTRAGWLRESLRDHVVTTAGGQFCHILPAGYHVEAGNLPKPTQFLTLLHDGDNYLEPQLLDAAAVEARRVRVHEASDGNITVVTIPLPTVLAAPELLTNAKTLLDTNDRDIPPQLFGALETLYATYKKAIGE